MYKTVGLVILHYGKEYLYYTLQSLLQAVDAVVIVYSSVSSHNRTDLVCPETRDDLLAELSFVRGSADQQKIYWHDRVFSNEWEHRNYAFEECKKLGADVIAVADADEVWDPEELKKAIAFARENNKARYRIMMQHFYRSFNEVCRDPHRQVRLMCPNAPSNEEIDMHTENPVIHHFGYAQSESIIRYKISCHGHKSEFRPEWFEKKFLKYIPFITKDVHPVCHSGFWNPEPYDKEKLPDILKGHPYYHKEII